MTDIQESNRWSSYDKRVGTTVSHPEKLDWFLSHLKPNAHVLDFGAGTARWAKQMVITRPDISVEVLDARADELSGHYNIPQITKHISTTFEDFNAPPKSYDAIWARSALFFIIREHVSNVLQQLAASLKPEGILEFNGMESISQAYHLPLFHPTPQSAMLTMLEQAGLDVVEHFEECGKYTSKHIELPGYVMRCRRVS